MTTHTQPVPQSLPAPDAGPHRHARPLTVILLNWNGYNETVIGLDALLQQDYKDYSLVVLDNGSTDDSVERLVAWFAARGIPLAPPPAEERVGPSCVVHVRGENVVLLKNAVNEGFTGGNNIAVAYALAKLSPEYIFLLNNDAVLEKDCLQRCLDLARSHNAGIVGAFVKGTDRKSIVFAGANPVRELFFSSPAPGEDSLPDVWETGRVEASGELVDARFWREHHAKWGYYLDPRFFIYCEETDLAFSAHDLGKKILMSKHAVIYHGVAISMGGAGNPMQYYYITRNRIFLAQRWLPPALRILFHLYFVPTRIARMIQRRIEGKSAVAAAIWEGVVDGYGHRYGQWKRHRSRS